MQTMISDGGTQFRDVSHLHLVPVLFPIAKHFRALLDTKLRDLGLEVGNDQLLLAIDELSSNAVSHLADQLAVRPSTLSKMTDRLVSKGLVKRGRLEMDARVTVLHLTDEGIQMKTEVRRIHEMLNEELANALRLDENENMLPALVSVAAALSKRLARLR